MSHNNAPVKVTDQPLTCYSLGLVYASVCTSLDDELATAAMNIQHPTGIPGDWRISDDPMFAGGEPNPCLCHQEVGRRHLLFEC